ncbi:MAG: DUF4358 domain-containing protein [Oscillospiraceae bacterium]|nr:DUF4358 domain-containing protein [Oscillospiraceae bacterium]
MRHVKKALLLALALLVCAGCAPDGPDLDPAEVVRAMMAADTTLPEMTERSGGEGGADGFTYLSGLDYDRVEDYFYACASAGTAEEMAVVKLKDKADAAALMDSLADHLEARQDAFAQYDPEQVPLTESAVLTREGRYVALIVSQKNGLAQQEFQKFFQEGGPPD